MPIRGQNPRRVQRNPRNPRRNPRNNEERRRRQIAIPRPQPRPRRRASPRPRSIPNAYTSPENHSRQVHAQSNYNQLIAVGARRPKNATFLNIVNPKKGKVSTGVRTLMALSYLTPYNLPLVSNMHKIQGRLNFNKMKSSPKRKKLQYGKMSIK